MSTDDAPERSGLQIAKPIWQPRAGATWDWQLKLPVDTSVEVEIYDIDMFTATPALIASLHARGRKVICYLNVGAWEQWRADAAMFPPEVLGKPWSATKFTDERWLDIRRIDLLAPALGQRFDYARSLGCDAVEPDNLDGWLEIDGNADRTGFGLTADDQLRFNRWVADEVHRRGMAVALKNDPAQAAELEPYFDFVVSEQCFDYYECEKYKPFADSGKAILLAEYVEDLGACGEEFFLAMCADADRMGISAILKRNDLDAWRRTCPTQSRPGGATSIAASVRTEACRGATWPPSPSGPQIGVQARPAAPTTIMTRAFDFVKTRMRNPLGGVYTNLLDNENDEDVYVYGHHVTSEHMGLMLLASAALDDPQAFEESFRFVAERMVSARTGLVFWAIDKRTQQPYGYFDSDTPFYNSPLDDFRVVNGLIAGYERWGDARYLDVALRIGRGLYERCVERSGRYARYPGGLVTNGYGWAETRDLGYIQADLVPINYADLWTMRWLSLHDARWHAVVDSAAQLMEASQIPSSGQFYGTYYPNGQLAGDWEYQPIEVGEDMPPAGKVKTIQSLWTAIHLARINRKASAQRAYDFYKAQYERTGHVAEYYDYDGSEPREPYFDETLRKGEARIYAQLVRLAYYLGDGTFADRLARDKLEADQFTDPGSPLHGYIGRSTSDGKDAEAFNVLEALLGLAMERGAPAVSKVFAK
ncbi:MAG: endo alpha-1,4 polygalactosaminidase [Polyangiales bacterium]